MMWIMMQYKVKPEHLERHLELHDAVYKELAAHQPDGLREMTFQAGDKRTFVAIVQADGMPVPGTENIAALQEYRDGIEERCDGPIVKTLLQQSGSYNFD